MNQEDGERAKWAEARRLYQSGATATEAGRAVGLSPSAVKSRALRGKWRLSIGEAAAQSVARVADDLRAQLSATLAASLTREAELLRNQAFKRPARRCPPIADTTAPAEPPPTKADEHAALPATAPPAMGEPPLAPSGPPLTEPTWDPVTGLPLPSPPTHADHQPPVSATPVPPVPPETITPPTSLPDANGDKRPIPETPNTPLGFDPTTGLLLVASAADRASWRQKGATKLY